MRIEEIDERFSRVLWDDPSECPVGYRTFALSGVVFDRADKYACLYCGTLTGREGSKKYWKRVGLPETGEFLAMNEVCTLCVNPDAVNIGQR
jgi:hypothetical protein